MASYRNKCGRWSLVYFDNTASEEYKTAEVRLSNAFNEAQVEALLNVTLEELRDLKYLIDRAVYWKEVEKSP